jgi:hypothetical protein
MVHRDFKPGNVLLGPDGPVLIDFGLAAVPGMTTMGPSGQVAVGTPAFMAPEQLAGTRVTPAADMWSWAVTMVFAGTGELPFKGESLTATAYAILHSEPHVGRLPEPLGSLVYRCLNKDPAVRPSARGVLGELVAAGAQLIGPMPPMVSALATDEETSSSQRASAVSPQGNGAGLIAGQPASRRRPARRGSSRTWRRRRAAVLLAAIVLVAGAGVVAFNLPRHGASSDRPASNSQSQELAAETVARTQAIDWILHQVSPATIVSCDQQVCADLASAGFPSASLLTLVPGSNDVLGSALVVDTAAVQAQFGGRLESVYAPAVIASFGSGSARIDIRWVFSDGTATYSHYERQALSARKVAGAQLVANSQLKVSATARAQLLSGDIDPRLEQLLAEMADIHPVRIVDFVNQSPGGGPASLLRSVDLAAVDGAAHMTRAAYLGWMQEFLDSQRAQYRPAWPQQVTPGAGQAVLIGYAAPTPYQAPSPS